MRTGNRGATLALTLLLVLAAGATVLGGLGVFAKTAYAQKAQLCLDEDCTSGAGTVSCAVVGAGGCSCSCSGPGGTNFQTICVCGAPICHAWSFDRRTCYYRIVTCTCNCGANSENNNCSI